MNLILVFVSILFALMLATAQTLWKIAVEKNSLESTSLNSYIQVFLSAQFIIGALLYIISVVVYLYALAHYDFSKVQSLAIPLSLIFSILSAWLIFSENLKPENILGIFIIVIGIFLVVAR